MANVVAQGGIINLPVIFRDGAGGLVDPINPLLEILDPASGVVVSGLVPTRVSQGQYHYGYLVAADAPTGAWTGRFTGTINGELVVGDEPFTVILPGTASSGSLPYITLAELKTALNISPTDNRKDNQYSALIPWASTAIANYTERDFGAPLVTEERSYIYPDDAGGFLEIDDATTVSQVSLAVPHGTDLVLTTDEWVALPARRSDSPVFTYLALPGFSGAAAYSPEMGFTRNLDVYAREGRLRGIPTTLKVTADWGWPNIPSDVKLATIWTIEDWISRSAGEGVTAESIESFSRSYGSRSTGTVSASLAIPNRARDLLANYANLSV